MASEENIDTRSLNVQSEETRSDSGSDVTNQTLDDSLDEINIQPTLIRVSSPGPNGKETTEISGPAIGPNLENVNLNISVKVNNSNLKGKKVKDEPGFKEHTVDVAPYLAVKAATKDECSSVKDKDGKYIIDLQFTINMDKLKKEKGHKERRRRHKSDSDMNKGGGRSSEGRGSDDDNDDFDLGEGAVGGNLSDAIPEEPEGPSGAGTPRGGHKRRENGDFLSPETAKKLGTDYQSGYDSGYFDYGKKIATTDLEQQEGDGEEQQLPTLQFYGSLEDTMGETEVQRQESFDKSKKKSKSDIRKERAKRLKDKFTQPPRLVLRRCSTTDVNVKLPEGQSAVKPGRRYSITAANEQHKVGSSDEEALDDADTEKLDTLIVLNKLRNFLRKNMPELKRNKENPTDQSARPVLINGTANYARDYDNRGLENLPLNLPGGQDLDISFTTEDGEHSGEVTPRNASDTDEDEGLQEQLTPHNSSPSLERRVRTTRSHQLQSDQPNYSADKLNMQTEERKTRLTRQMVKEDCLTTTDLQTTIPSSQTKRVPQANQAMRLVGCATEKKMQRIPSIEVSNVNDETVTVVEGREIPKAKLQRAKFQRAKSESAVSQGLLAPYCKIDMGAISDSEEVFTLSAARSPHFARTDDKGRRETLKMDSSGHTKAEIVMDCEHPENLTAEELGISLAEGEELQILPVLVLDAEPNEQSGDERDVAEFPHQFAPIGIIPLNDERGDFTEKELNDLTEKAETILKETERGAVFRSVQSPNFSVGRPKAPLVVQTKVLRRAATEAHSDNLRTMEEPAMPTVRMRSPGISRRALSECGSPRGSPRISRRELYREFFEPTRSVTRSETEECSPIEKRHHDVMENLNQMQFDKQILGEDISTSGLGGYHKSIQFQRSNSRDSIGSDSSSGGSKAEQPKRDERVFVFPPAAMNLRNSVRSDSDKDDTASLSSGSGISLGGSIKDRRKSLEDKIRQDEHVPVRHTQPVPRSLNFSNVHTGFERKISEGSDGTPVLDANRTRTTSEPKLGASEKPPEYTGIRSKFQKLIAGNGIPSPRLARRPVDGKESIALTKTVDEKREPMVDDKTEETATWKQQELDRSKSEGAAVNSNNSNSRTKSCPTPRTDDEWFMPTFEQKSKGKERRTRDVSPFRDEDTDWFFSSEIKSQSASQQHSRPGWTIHGSPDARQKRTKWSETVQKQSRKLTGGSSLTESDTKLTTQPIGQGKKQNEPITKSKVSLNLNNNARKIKPTKDENEQDWLFLQRPGIQNPRSSPVQFRKHPYSKPREANYGLTIQAKGNHERSRSSAEPNYGLTIQTTVRPRTVSQGSETDDVFMDYPGAPRSPILTRATSQSLSASGPNPFKDYRPIGRHQPIVIDGRTPPQHGAQAAAASPASPKMSRTVSDLGKTGSRPSQANRSQNFQQQPRPQRSRSSPSQSSLQLRAMANNMRQSPRESRESGDYSQDDCQQAYPSMTSLDSGWYSNSADRLNSTMGSDVFDFTEQDGYSSDTTDTPGRLFFPLYANGVADDTMEERGPQAVPIDSAINQLLDVNDGYGSDDELFRQRCIDVFKTLHHEDVVYQQFQKLLRFRQRRISLHKDKFKIIPQRDDRSESDSDNVAYLV